MASKPAIKKDDRIIVFEKELGYIRARAMEDAPHLGGLALFKIAVNSPVLPGVSEMVINVNFWEVYHEDDPELLSKLRDQFLPHHITR